jgi:tight adherence protein C
VVAFAASLAVFIAVGACVIAIMQARVRPAEQRLARLAQRGVPFDQGIVNDPMIGKRSRGVMIRLVPGGFGAGIDRMLESAGSTMTTSVFLSVWLLSAIVGILAVPMLFLLLSGHVGVGGVFLTMPVAMAGLVLPIYLLRRGVMARRSAVWRGLPDACDLITLSVEAGLGLDSALRLVSQKLKGPLPEEVTHALREIQLGRPRKEALEAMAERVKLPALSTFVQSLVQTEQLGTSLGMVLRAQGISIRVQRRQLAQELVRKAPVKMVFPLVFCTIPAFFIITIGPVIVKVATEMSK